MRFFLQNGERFFDNVSLRIGKLPLKMVQKHKAPAGACLDNKLTHIISFFRTRALLVAYFTVIYRASLPNTSYKKTENIAAFVFMFPYAGAALAW
jgi:hypothetical protein